MIRESVEAIETSLRQITGILSARIRTDGEEVTEVHVVAAPHRRAKGVVRDVVTTLYARHGVDLNHRKVSVATTATDGDGPPELPAVRRLLFRSVNVYRDGSRHDGQVELQDGDRILTGTASGPAVRSGQERLVAQATLSAVSRLLGDGAALELLGVERRRIGSRAVMLVHLVLLRKRNETHLVGSALAGPDPLEATVFAVLDALNRILPVLSGEDTVEYEVEDLPPEAAS